MVSMMITLVVVDAFWCLDGVIKLNEDSLMVLVDISLVCNYLLA